MRNRAVFVLTGALVASAVPTACVFPTYRVTGLELSWRFLETNEADGEEGMRARTCDGARASQIEVDVLDEDDDERQHVFVYECEAGYQTPEEFQIRASDAFVALNPGSYRVTMRAVDATGTLVLAAEDTVDVEDRVATPLRSDLGLGAVDWTLELSGTDACTDLELRLLYADPETSLAPPPEETDTGTGAGEGLEVLYRQMLTSDTGLSLGGDQAACADVAGKHVFAGIDTGSYLLEIVRDGESCKIPVTVHKPEPSLTLDLSNPTC